MTGFIYKATYERSSFANNCSFIKKQTQKTITDALKDLTWFEEIIFRKFTGLGTEQEKNTNSLAEICGLTKKEVEVYFESAIESIVYAIKSEEELETYKMKEIKNGLIKQAHINHKRKYHSATTKEVERLKDYMHLLSERQYAAIILYARGRKNKPMRYEEIAKILNCKASAVGKSYLNGMEILREAEKKKLPKIENTEFYNKTLRIVKYIISFEDFKSFFESKKDYFMLLSPKEELVIRLMYEIETNVGRPLQTEEIAELINCTLATTMHFRNKAIKKLSNIQKSLQPLDTIIKQPEVKEKVLKLVKPKK
jgi:hypothetical protein